MVRVVESGGNVVRYVLERKNVKNVNLRIRADQSVFVSAAREVPAKEVDAFVRQKGEYILRCLKRFRERANLAVPEKACVDGETVRLFGRSLRIRVERAAENGVECDESYLTLRVTGADVALRKKLLQNWLDERCKAEISEICGKVHAKLRRYGVARPEVRFRQMVSRWGSCSPKKGIITFNTALVAMPASCIEYVVTHEFTHLLCPNHSKKFYQQLATFMPDWEERKKRLEKTPAA